MNKVHDIKMVKIDEIKVNSKNRNAHSKEQIERLVKIIQDTGFRSPLVISKLSGKLVAGHGRLIAAKELNYQELPVVYQDFQDEDEEYRAGISLNAISSWSELDLSGINMDIQEIGPFDLDLLGIKDFEINLGDKTDNDEGSAEKIPQTCPHCGKEI